MQGLDRARNSEIGGVTGGRIQCNPLASLHSGSWLLFFFRLTEISLSCLFFVSCWNRCRLPIAGVRRVSFSGDQHEGWTQSPCRLACKGWLCTWPLAKASCHHQARAWYSSDHFQFQCPCPHHHTLIMEPLVTSSHPKFLGRANSHFNYTLRSCHSHTHFILI